MTRTPILPAICLALAVTVAACNNSGDNKQAAAVSTPPAAQTPAPAAAPGDGPFKPPPIVVASNLPDVKIDGKTGSLPLSSAASYGWSALIALNWPAASAANTRGLPDTAKPFGQPGTPTWVTMRSKNEIWAGNVSATVAPHGVVLDPVTHAPTNGPDYGYGDAPQYNYSAGPLKACPGQAEVTTPALVVMDETTEINNNQTYAGAAPAKDPNGYNSQPQLIRYAVKMNRSI